MSGKHQAFDDRVWQTIAEWIDRHHYAPSIRELVALCEVHSTSTIHQALDRLDRAGRIRRGEKQNRALSVVRECER